MGLEFKAYWVEGSGFGLHRNPLFCIPVAADPPRSDRDNVLHAADPLRPDSQALNPKPSNPKIVGASGRLLI